MKPFNYYTSVPLPYPNRKDFYTFYVYDKGEVLATVSGTEMSRNRLAELYPNALIQGVLDEGGWKDAVGKYNDVSQSLEREFKRDLLEEYGVTNNPKADLCYQIAWDIGHANGINEVSYYFEAFVELIRD